MTAVRQAALAVLLLILAMTLASTINAFKCPDNCECTTVLRGAAVHNHVHCTNLDGLRSLGKTSEIDSLDLSNLDLTKITNQLDKMSNLAKLDLSGNQLAEVNSLTNKHIRTLNLARNRLTSGKLLTIPEHVKHLELSANNITELPLDFKRLVSLKSLELHGNPLNCSCETLEVRNWLQEKLVWTDRPITCASPPQFEGKPWLQVRQTDVCEPKTDNEPRIMSYGGTEAADDEYEVMLGDDPSVTDIEAESKDDGDAELVQEFLPVKPNEESKKTESSGDNEYLADQYDDGSGAEEEDATSPPIEHSTDEEMYEGSGDEVTEVPITARKFGIVESHLETTTAAVTESDPDSHGVVLFNSEILPNANASHEDINHESTTIIDAVPLLHKFEDSDAKAASGSQQLDKISLDTKPNDESKESKSTYILLAVLAVLLIVLILFVAMKRKKKPAKTPVDDSRSGARELLPVQKKPQIVGQNGSPEIVPLISQNGKPNTGNGVSDLEGPLLKKLNGPDEADDRPPTAEVKYENELSPATTPQPPTAPASPNKEYQPVSPNPSRYSPVSDTFTSN